MNPFTEKLARTALIARQHEHLREARGESDIAKDFAEVANLLDELLELDKRLIAMRLEAIQAHAQELAEPFFGIADLFEQMRQQAKHDYHNHQGAMESLANEFADSFESIAKLFAELRDDAQPTQPTEFQKLAEVIRLAERRLKPDDGKDPDE